MTFALVLKIGGALLALAVGLWLGLPGRYTQSPDDIEKVMDSGLGRRRKRKQPFTPLAWVQRKISTGAGGGGARRRGFKIESPEDR